ncbi:MAG: glycosyltransferase family 2 protein [Bacteroidales bacterium]|nr:glycosyltransferase family 2 protein [Bacteroidales bacterium]
MENTNNHIVSIIIPAYNAEKFLEETVASAMASTYPFLEIIIVNDGSTDNTKSVIHKIKTQYPQIRSFEQKNSGVAVARNLAIRKARGKYILPLDADDLITPDYIEKAVEIISTNDQVKVVYCLAEFFGNKTGHWKLPPFNRKLLARKNLIFVTALYRKSDYEKTDGYRPEIKGPEDWDFWISMLKTGGEVVRIPKVCFYYRIHENSKRVAMRSKKKEGIDLMNQRHKAFFHRSLGGKLHYIRACSGFFNFFQGLLNAVKVVLAPGYESYDELMYNIPYLLNSLNQNVVGKSHTKIIHLEHHILRVETFQSPGFYKLIKSRNNATRRYKSASGSSVNGNDYFPLGYYEQFSNFVRYTGYFVEIKKKTT